MNAVQFNEIMHGIFGLFILGVTGVLLLGVIAIILALNGNKR
jgi:hypothetical protein